MTSTPSAFDAVLFDLDGVLTATSALHAAAWKQTFDAVLDEPFDTERAYLAHVDGKPRLDGVRTAVVSSSTNSRAVLGAAGIGGLCELTFDARGAAPDDLLAAGADMVVGHLGELV
jgi:phosphoglycolate phosphatase-like HAD superfamily hydrolase